MSQADTIWRLPEVTGIERFRGLRKEPEFMKTCCPPLWLFTLNFTHSLSSLARTGLCFGAIQVLCKLTRATRICWLECMLSRVQLFMTPRTAACQATLTVEFSRQEYWSELPFPAPGDLPHQGLNPCLSASPALAGGFFTTVQPGKPHLLV